MNIPMIDTLCVNIDIEDYQNSAKELLGLLEIKKEEAKLVAANNASENVYVKIGNLTFNIKKNGSKDHAYILHNDGYEVKLMQYRMSKEEFYPIFIKIKSEYLWAYGPEQSWDYIKSWVHTNIGPIKSNKLQRLDPCCHTDEYKFILDDFHSFKGRFKKTQLFFQTDRTVNQVSFGARKGSIYSRIYDKVLEVKERNKKKWFYDIWTSKGLDPQRVWNIEFEIKRDFFRERQIETVEDALSRIRSIWEYCTEQWLQKVDLVNTRKERCPTSKEWISIQKVFSRFESEPLVKREKQLLDDAEALIPNIIGSLTSYAAKRGLTDKDIIFKIVEKSGINYLANKQMSYETAINKKMAIMKESCEV